MILGLQYCEKDFARSMQLARLLADLEPTYRPDVLLALVRDSSFEPQPADVDSVVEHCSAKFPVEQIVLPQADRGWPRGPNRQWSGMMEHFAHKRDIDHRTQQAVGIGSRGRYDSIFVFDGGDGVPLHRGWIDLLLAEHARTIERGKLVTGTIGIDNTNRFHINGNVILETEIWHRLPELHECPDHDAWDCYHFQTFYPHASLSSIIRNDWRYPKKPTREVLSEIAQSSAWWHGCKDENLCDVARSHLLDHPPDPPPVLTRWQSLSEYAERSGIRHKPWVNGHSVSLTTGCMNRREFLAKALPTWTRTAVPNEIVIVDWSSQESLRDLLPLDPRIVVVRVTDQEHWNNAKCHNLEFRLARGGIVLRLDSDYLLGPIFFPKHPLRDGAFYAGNWQTVLDSDKKSLSGALYAHRADLYRVNGYNERLDGYGQEEDDLFDRLAETGLERLDVDLNTMDHIPHGDELRYKNLKIAPDVPELFQKRRASLSPFQREIMTTERLFLIDQSKRMRREQPWTPADRMTRWRVQQIADRYYECQELAPGEKTELPWTTIECNP